MNESRKSSWTQQTVASICVTVSFMDKVQSSDTDRFSKCASIEKGGGGCERDRDAFAYVVPQLAKSASVWKGSMEGEGRRKKIEKNERKKKRVHKNQKSKDGDS